MQVRVLGFALVNHIQVWLNLCQLLVLMVLDLLLIAHRHEEIVLKCRNLKILQQNCLIILLQLGHKFGNLLLVYARRTAVKQRTLYQLATRYLKLVKRILTLTSFLGFSGQLVARLGSWEQSSWFNRLVCFSVAGLHRADLQVQLFDLVLETGLH